MAEVEISRKSLSDLDLAIRQGRARSARIALRDALQGRSFSDFPREFLPELASLSRRVGAPEWAIRLLNPLVRPTGRKRSDATPRETAEYGAALVSLGAISEAQGVLSKTSSTECIESSLYRAFARFARWDYHASLPDLEAYLRSVDPASYLRDVARINYAAALIATDQFDRVEELLVPMIRELESAGKTLLLGNAWTLLAQSRVLQGDWDAAESALSFSEERIGKVPGFDGLLIRKWRAVLDLRSGVGSPRAIEAMRSVQKSAIELGHWESVRDADFHLAWAAKDRELWTRLYFGTPHSAYRERVMRESGIDFSAEGKYLWRISSGDEPARILDLSHPEGLKPGLVQHRLLLALASDFYRPQRLAALHESLFPDRHYHPISSPDIVHQALKRLRASLQKTRIGLQVHENRGSYRLLSKRSLSLLVPAESRGSSESLKLRSALDFLSGTLGPEFTVSRGEAAMILGVSSRSAYSVLQTGVQDGSLKRQGSGPRVRYSSTRFPLGK